MCPPAAKFRGANTAATISSPRVLVSSTKRAPSVIPQRIGVGVVIAHVRTGVGLGDPEVGEQQGDRLVERPSHQFDCPLNKQVRRCLEHPRRAVLAAGGHPGAVRAERHRQDRAAMVDAGQLGAGGRGEHPGRAVPAAGGHYVTGD